MIKEDRLCTRLFLIYFVSIGSLNLICAHIDELPMSINELRSESQGSVEPIPIGSGGLKLLLNVTSERYVVTVGGDVWLNSTPTFFTSNGRRFSATVGGGLELIDIYEDEGMDNVGSWTSTILRYRLSLSSRSSAEVLTEFRAYDHQPNVIMFGQHFPSGLEGTSIDEETVLSSGFPSFYVDSSSQLAYLSFGGIMFGDTEKTFGRWASNDIEHIESGLDSGPLVLFNGIGDAVVISSYSSFMAMSSGIEQVETSRPTISWGVLGTASSIPSQFSVWTVISYSPHGVNQAMQSWGDILRKKYNRGREFTDSELTNNYIGYYTDNGAYYYYLTERGQSYEDTILMVRENSQKLNIPFRYIQYDSWFYPKGPQDGVTEWVSMPEVFPHGMQYTWNKTGWVSVAHNRWWSDKTVYAKENGGKYEFIIEHKTVKKALPMDKDFWVDLFRESRKWGLTVYEQDWLNLQFNSMTTVISSTVIGHKWLMLMGEGARKNGLNIQYCMAPTRVALMSLLLPNVVQGRVSEDYQPGNDQWKIGVSSMLAHAIGVAPFKDNFWTTSEQPGNIYNLTEPFPELQSVVATLSTGPVAPGDKIGYANVELIMRSCNADGLILKPSKPATAVDEMIYKRARHEFDGEVWSTYSLISGHLFGIVLAADFKPSDVITLTPHQAGFGHKLSYSIVYPWFSPGLKSVRPFTDSQPLKLTNCYTNPFCLYLTSPLIHVGSNEVYLIGEQNKWVSMSPRRVSNIEVSQSELTISLEGASNDSVHFTYVVNNRIVTIDCVLSVHGQAILHLLAKKCIIQ